MATLSELANKYGTDKRPEDHNYTPMYEKLLSLIEVNSLLEIGLGSGASMRMWIDYYPNAKVYCIEDFGEENERLWGKADGNIEGLNLISGDSTIKETWDKVPFELDFIVDDGDHHPDSQIKTLVQGFSHLRTGGLYFIEDTHCNFTELYTGGKDIIYSSIFDLIVKQQIPRMSTDGNFYRNIPYMAAEARPILSYHFYKSIIALEKA
jgi:hypothetical protein